LGGGKFGRVIVQNRATMSSTGIHLAPLGVLVVEIG
jgi:hypothetical protein